MDIVQKCVRPSILSPYGDDLEEIEYQLCFLVITTLRSASRMRMFNCERHVDSWSPATLIFGIRFRYRSSITLVKIRRVILLDVFANLMKLYLKQKS